MTKFMAPRKRNAAAGYAWQNIWNTNEATLLKNYEPVREKLTVRVIKDIIIRPLS